MSEREEDLEAVLHLCREGWRMKEIVRDRVKREREKERERGGRKRGRGRNQ